MTPEMRAEISALSVHRPMPPTGWKKSLIRALNFAIADKIEASCQTISGRRK
jgi:hypothetical protein